MLVPHLLARRGDRPDLLRGKLHRLDRVLPEHEFRRNALELVISSYRRRRDATSTHDLDEVRASLELLAGRLEYLRNAVACAA